MLRSLAKRHFPVIPAKAGIFGDYPQRSKDSRFRGNDGGWKVFIFSFFFVLFGAVTAQAACTPTPSVGTQNYPGHANIPSGNNLLKPAGKAEEASGQRVVIYGTLLDNRCIPVRDAEIQLWQVDPFGKWMLANREDLVNATPVFTGAGRTYSDAEGHFMFIAAFPAGVAKRAPHYDIRVGYEDEKDFNTALYFSADGRNAGDAIYNKLSASGRQAVSMQVNEAGAAGLAAETKIVLPYSIPYDGY